MPQYQGVWTLQQQAQAQSNQQWVTDPNFKNTTLLLQADGAANTAQNNLFLDTSPNQFTITRNGNTTQGSFSPFSQAPGYWGNYFSGGYLRTTSSTALGFSTNPFTIEAWVYMVDRAAKYSLVGGVGVSSQVFIQTNGTLVFSIPGVIDLSPSTGTVPLNAWTHIALVRSSTSTNGFAYYINGAAAGTATLSNDLGTASATVEVGLTNGGAGATSWTGYISNIRVVKGTAVYTSAFTPSTIPLTAITNTSLLTCQSNRFVDNSTANATFTTSNVSVQAFGPFAPALQWTPDVVGGSGYFDGSGDYLNTASSSAFNLSSVSWTIECFVYLGDYTGDARIWSIVSSATNMYGVYLRSGTLYIGLFGTGEVSMGSVTKGQWYHIAFVNVAGTITCYKNGVSAGTASYTFPNTDCSFYIAGSPANYATFTTQGYIASLRVLKGTALYTTTFTPPTAPLTAITNTQLLLNYTNAGIYDGKMANNLETVGNAQVSTSVVKYGSGSMYLNSSTSDGLRINEYLNYQFGTGDFTVECWINCPSFSSSQVIFDARGNNVATTPWQFYVNTSSKLVFNYGSNLTGSMSVPTNTWTHVVAARANGILRMFVNGVFDSFVTTTASLNGVGAPVYVGRTFDTSGTVYFTGYIDDLRITKGVARYIANFTPPQQALPRQ